MLRDEDKEWLKLYFEFFKHLTTLSVATSVIILALYQQTGISLVVVGLVLVCFLVATVLCLLGMEEVMAVFGGQEEYSRSKLSWRRYHAVAAFIIGLGLFFSGAVLPGLPPLLP